jgi:hypothetical protein
MFVLYAENSRFFPAIFSFFAMELLKTNKGFATIPFNTFFSKEEFFRAIEETNINPLCCSTPQQWKDFYFNVFSGNKYPFRIYKFDSFLAYMTFLVDIIMASFGPKTIFWWFRAFFYVLLEGAGRVLLISEIFCETI